MYSYSGEPASQMDAHYMDAQIADHLATVAAGIPSSLHHRGKQVAYHMAGQHMPTAGVTAAAACRLKQQQQQQQQQQHHQHHYPGYSSSQASLTSVHPTGPASMMETVSPPQRLVAGGINQNVLMHSKSLHRLAAGGGQQMIHNSSPSQRSSGVSAMSPHYSSASQLVHPGGISQGMPTHSSASQQRADPGGVGHRMSTMSGRSQMMHGSGSVYGIPSSAAYPKQYPQHQGHMIPGAGASTHGNSVVNNSMVGVRMTHSGSIQTGYPKSIVSQSGVKIAHNNDSYTQVGKINAGLVVSPAVPSGRASPPHSYARSAHSANSLQAGPLRISGIENAVLQESAMCRSKNYTSVSSERSADGAVYKNSYSAGRSNSVRASHPSDYHFLAKTGAYPSEKGMLPSRMVMVNESVGQRVNLPMSLSPISPAEEDPPSPQFDVSLVSPSSTSGGHMRLGSSDRPVGAVKSSATGAVALSRSQYEILHADMAQGRGRMGSIQPGYRVSGSVPRGYRASTSGGSVPVKGVPSQSVPAALASPVHQSPSVSPYVSMRTETPTQKQSDKAYVIHPAGAGTEAAPIDLSNLGKNSSSAQSTETPLDLSVKTTKRPADASDLSDQRPSSAKRQRPMHHASSHEPPIAYTNEFGKVVASAIQPNCDMRYQKQQQQQLLYNMQQGIQQANRKADVRPKLEVSEDRTLKDNGMCNTKLKPALDINMIKTHSDMMQSMSAAGYHLVHPDRAAEHKLRSEFVDKDVASQCYKMAVQAPQPLQSIIAAHGTGEGSVMIQEIHALSSAQKPHLIKSEVSSSNSERSTEHGTWPPGAPVVSYQQHIRAESIDPSQPQKLQLGPAQHYGSSTESKSFVYKPIKEDVDQRHSNNVQNDEKPNASQLLHSKSETRTPECSTESPVMKDKLSDSQSVPSYEMRLPVDSGHIVNVSNIQLNSILVPKTSAVPQGKEASSLPSSKTWPASSKPRLLDSLPIKIDQNSSGSSDVSETEAENSGEAPEKDLFKFTQPLSIAIPSSKTDQARKPIQPSAVPNRWSRKQRILNQFNQDEDMKRKVFASPVSVHKGLDHIFKMPNISPASPSSPKMPTLSPHDKQPLPENSSLNNDPPTLDLPDTPDKKAAAKAEGKTVDGISPKSIVPKEKSVLQRSGAIRVSNVVVPKEENTNVKSSGEIYARRQSLPDGPLRYQKNIPVANVAPFVHSEKVETPTANQLSDSVTHEQIADSEMISQLEEMKDMDEDEEVKEDKPEDHVTVTPKQKKSSNLTKKVMEKKRNKMSVSKATLRDLKRTESQLKSEQLKKVVKQVSKSSSPDNRLKRRIPRQAEKVEVGPDAKSFRKQKPSRLRKSLRHLQAQTVKRSLEVRQKSLRLSHVKQQSEGDDTVESASDSEPPNEEKNLQKVLPDSRLLAKERTMRKAVIQVNRLEDTFDVSALQSTTKNIKSVSNLNKRAQALKQRAIDGPGRCGSQRRQCRRLSQSSHTSDLRPKVWEMTTRNKLAGRRRVLKYNRNDAYEKELKRDESRKATNRTKRRTCVRRKPIATDDKLASADFVADDNERPVKYVAEGDDSDSEGRWEIKKSQDDLRQTLRSGKNKGGLMMKLHWRHPVGNDHIPAVEDQSEKDEMVEPRGLRKRLLMTKKQMRAMAKRRRNRSIQGQFCDKSQQRDQYQQFTSGYENIPDQELCAILPQDDYETDVTSTSEFGGTLTPSSLIPIPPEYKKLSINKNSGETMLHRAARLGYVDVALYCLRTSAVDVNARDNAGYTPLHESCVRGDLIVARELITHGGNVNCCSQDGIRPIHDAVENDHIQIVRLLLSWGADPLLATYGGKTPLKIARSIAMLLLLQGYLGDMNGFEPDDDGIIKETFWEFQGSSDFMDSAVSQGFDVFADIPSDPEDEDDSELFEMSETAMITSYDLPLDDSQMPERCFAVGDVLQKLKLTREEFNKLEGAEESIVKLPREVFVQTLTTCAVQIPKLNTPFIELVTQEDFSILGSPLHKTKRKAQIQLPATHAGKKTEHLHEEHSSSDELPDEHKQWQAKIQNSENIKKFRMLSLEGRTKEAGKGVKRFPSSFQRRSLDKSSLKTVMPTVGVSKEKSESEDSTGVSGDRKPVKHTGVSDKLKSVLGCEKLASDKWKLAKKDCLQKKPKKPRIRKDKCISKWLIRKRHTSTKKKKYAKQKILSQLALVSGTLGQEVADVNDNIVCGPEGQHCSEKKCKISLQKHDGVDTTPQSSTRSHKSLDVVSNLRSVSKTLSTKSLNLSKIGKISATPYGAQGKISSLSSCGPSKSCASPGGAQSKSCVQGKNCGMSGSTHSKSCALQGGVQGKNCGTQSKSCASQGGVQGKNCGTPGSTQSKSCASQGGGQGKNCGTPGSTQSKSCASQGGVQGKNCGTPGSTQSKSCASQGGVQGKNCGTPGSTQSKSCASQGGVQGKNCGTPGSTQSKSCAPQGGGQGKNCGTLGSTQSKSCAPQVGGQGKNCGTPGSTQSKSCAPQGGGQGKNSGTPGSTQSKSCAPQVGGQGKNCGTSGSTQSKDCCASSIDVQGSSRGKESSVLGGSHCKAPTSSSHGKVANVTDISQEKTTPTSGASQGKASSCQGDAQGKTCSPSGGSQWKSSVATEGARDTSGSTRVKLPLKCEQLQRPNIYSFDEDEPDSSSAKMPRMKRDQEIRKQSEQLYCFDDDSTDEEITFRKVDYKHSPKAFKSTSAVTATKHYSQNAQKKSDQRDLQKRNNNA